MEDRIRTILSNEYNLSIDSLTSMDGGYNLDETYLLVTSNQMKYVVKYIKYLRTQKYLQSILNFQNILHDSYNYPCPEIIRANSGELVISESNRLLFVQTFIEGNEPTIEILDKDEKYLQEMGRFLAQWRLVSCTYLLNTDMKEEYEEFTSKWWEKQDMTDVDPFLVSNLMECKQDLINLTDRFQRGVIHNDFHPNNSLMRNDQTIFLIDFIDACQSLFVADLATSIFHLLVNHQNGKHRAKLFLYGYQQIVSLTADEIDNLDKFVRLKLTMSIIEDLHHSSDSHDSFIQSCIALLNNLKTDPTLVKNLL